MTSSCSIDPALYPGATALLLLPDGSWMVGEGIGTKGITIGEICFNTAITGYEEIISDPSYAEQIITFTFPHIGNVGTNSDDMESYFPHAKGIIIRNPITSPSNYRSTHHFQDWLVKHNIIGISGLDTRKLTQHIRQKGSSNVLIYHANDLSNCSINSLLDQLHTAPLMTGCDLASKVSNATSSQWTDPLWQLPAPEHSYHVVAIDFGAKHNILRHLVSSGCSVTLLPATSSLETILSYQPDGIFLSNGPGNPAATATHAVPLIQQLIETGLPIFGICLGHQLLAHALGAKTRKMHQGHRGANHPVQCVSTGKVEITSQNHGFEIDPQSLPPEVSITHISLFDQSIEGIALNNKPVFSVQYHPESSPGPHDSHYLFHQFVDTMRQHKSTHASTPSRLSSSLSF
jgi:carbamoyl-phosphate synthase small subunit